MILAMQGKLLKSFLVDDDDENGDDGEEDDDGEDEEGDDDGDGDLCTFAVGQEAVG